MKTIKLTQDKSAIVDDENFDLLNQFNWFAVKRARPTGKDLWYAARMIRNSEGKRTMRYMHREVLAIMDPKVTVDHKSHTYFGGLDNRLVNLRVATMTGQSRNTRKQSHLMSKPTSSQYKGVYLDMRRNIWYSGIKVNYQKIFIGSFRNEEDAARAYDKKAEELFGNFAHKNFP